MSSDNNTDRERKVLELYNQGKTTRDIAKEIRMSLRDINIILKKGVNHGIVTVDSDDKKHHSNEKFTEAYKLFSEGKTLIQVSIIIMQ